MSRHFYSTVAVETTLTSGISNSATSMAVGSTTGFPGSFPYYLAIDFGAAGQEVVEVTNAVGLTLTIVRGVSGTTGVAHSAAASVIHVAPSDFYNETHAHAFATVDVHGVSGTLNTVIGALDTRLDALEDSVPTEAQGNIFVPASATSGTAIMAAIAALPANGGTITLGAGTHVLDVAVRFSKNLIIEGVGDVATIVQFNPALGAGFAMADATQRRIVMRDFRIDSSVPGTGTAIDASKFITSRFVCLRVGASTTAPNIGISFPVVGTYYNHIMDCVITASGTAPIGVQFADAANRNVITNTKVNILGSTTGVGVRVGALAHSILMMGLDVEGNDCVAVDVEATAHDVTMVGCYFEINTIGVRLAAGVESVRIVGGYISNHTTADIQDNGAVGLTIDNLWLNFNPYSSLDRTGVVKSKVNGINAPGNQYQPEDVGFKAWSYDPAVITNQTIVTNGSLYLCQINLRYAETITNLVVTLQAAAVTSTANQNYLGLYDAAGTRVATTAAGVADVPFQSVGTKTLALSAPYAAAAGKYWVAILANAATAPTIFRNGSTLSASPGLSAATARFALNGTALTALPASITPGSNVIASGIPYWVAAS